jgi:hypothetical protein
MGAGKTVTAAKDSRKNGRDFEVRENLGELHERIRCWHAVTIAANTIASYAQLTEGGVEVVRMLMVTAGSLATDTFDLSCDLQTATDPRSPAALADF